MIEEVIAYKYKGKNYNKLEEAKRAELEDKLIKLLGNGELFQVIEKLAKDKEHSRQLIKILEGMDEDNE